VLQIEPAEPEIGKPYTDCYQLIADDCINGFSRNFSKQKNYRMYLKMRRIDASRRQLQSVIKIRV
jgi:hypothetical protein